MAWLTAKEVTGRLGAPLFNCVQFCHVGWCCGWGGVYEHTCLSELYSLGPAPLSRRPGARVPPPSALGSQVGRLFGGLGHSCPCRGDLELCTCQYWGVVPTITSTMRLLLYLPYWSLLRSRSTIIYSPSACTPTTVSTVNGSWKLTGVDLIC